MSGRAGGSSSAGGRQGRERTFGYRYEGEYWDRQAKQQLARKAAGSRTGSNASGGGIGRQLLTIFLLAPGAVAVEVLFDYTFGRSLPHKEGGEEQQGEKVGPTAAPGSQRSGPVTSAIAEVRKDG